MAGSAERKGGELPDSWTESINERLVHQTIRATLFLEKLSAQKRIIVRAILVLVLTGVIGLPVLNNYLDSQYKSYQRELVATRASFGLSQVRESAEGECLYLSQDRLGFLGQFIFMDLSKNWDIEYDPERLKSFISPTDKTNKADQLFFLFIFKDRRPVSLERDDEQNKIEFSQRAKKQDLKVDVGRARTIFLQDTLVESLRGPADFRHLSRAEKEAWSQILGISVSLEIAAALHYPEIYSTQLNTDASPQVATFKRELWEKMRNGESPQMVKVRFK